MRVENKKLFDGINGAVEVASVAQQIEHGFAACVLGYTTTNGAGVLKVQVSNDPAEENHPERIESTSWVDLTSKTTTITTAGTGIIQMSDCAFRWCRLYWTPAATSGNETITVASVAHGMAAATHPTVTITNDSNVEIAGPYYSTITGADAFTFVITSSTITNGTLNWTASFGKNTCSYTNVDNMDGTFTITVVSASHGLLIGSTPTVTVAAGTDTDVNGTQTATVTTSGAFTFIVNALVITNGTLNWSGVKSGTTKAYAHTPIAVAGTATAVFNSKGA